MEAQRLRLWSVHPKYLDGQGLVALGREALLAQKVLKGETRGYKSHPQLERFRSCRQPQKAIGDYLMEVWEESKRRGFRFDKAKIGCRGSAGGLTVTKGQLEFEFGLLCQKLRRRAPEKYRLPQSEWNVLPHPLFEVVDGPAEEWEKTGIDVRW
jgi:hypothetical protein